MGKNSAMLHQQQHENTQTSACCTINMNCQLIGFTEFDRTDYFMKA